MATTSNQPAIRQLASADPAEATIAEQKQLLLDVLRKHGVKVACIAYNAFDGSFYPEAPFIPNGDPFPATATITCRWYGLPVTYASAAQLMRKLLEAVLALHHPGYRNDEGSEGLLSVNVAGGIFMLHHGERYTALTEMSKAV